MNKHPILIRTLGVAFVSLALGFLFYQFAHDIRSSVFIALVTAFAGSMFTMISIVTKES